MQQARIKKSNATVSEAEELVPKSLNESYTDPDEDKYYWFIFVTLLWIQYKTSLKAWSSSY